MHLAIIVGLGGFIGAIARYGVTSIMPQRPGSAFPWATFAVNLVGSFLLGLLMSYVHRHPSLSTQLRLFISAGILGSFTTFSALAFDCVELARHDALPASILTMAANVVFGLFAVVLGAALWNLVES